MKNVIATLVFMAGSVAFAGGSGGGSSSSAFTCADGSEIFFKGGGLLLSTNRISTSDNEFWESPQSVSSNGRVHTFSHTTKDDHGKYTYTPVATLTGESDSAPGTQAVLRFLQTNESEICIRGF